MAKLSSFSRNGKAMREGEWINPGPEYGGIEIRTKAPGPAYADARAAKLRRAARIAGGEAKVGQEQRNAIDVEALIEHCLLDVRGLEHDDGRPVTFDEFCKLLQQEEHAELAILAFTCASQVGQRKADQLEEAEGNS